MDILRKIHIVFKIIRQNGGIFGSLRTLWLTDNLKFGKLVGEDSLGNRYYENGRYFFGTNRWVMYSRRVGFNYDASQIPAEWYGWIHHRTDLLPSQDRHRPKYKWMSDQNLNLSGTRYQYVPYCTVRDKITPWDPKTYPPEEEDESAEC